ncbi:MAG TPA: outer membrane beta-barrel protein [Vicinamibacterales bacterium]|nr:outer membrane beta-barrel protein [Vicinamibacterales bacterium]
MKRLTLLTAMALCLAPAAASAEWIFTPFIGTSFAAGSETDDAVIEAALEGSKMTYGGTLTYLGGGILGFEVDLGYAPNYFEPGDDPSGDVDNSNYMSLMGNVILSTPRGAFRPYVTAGAGMLKTFVDGPDDAFDVDRNALGFNLGGGVFGFFTNRVGIRGDLRYFRQMTEADDGELDFDVTAFRFWRGTVGVSLRF